MNTRIVKASVIAAALAVVLQVAVSAHHSFAMYDQKKVVTLTGVVKQFVPQANHAEIHFMLFSPDHKSLLKGKDGKYVEWGLEMAGTAQLERPGEPSTVMLTTSVQEVNAGDKLVAAGRPQPITYAPHAPSSKISGRVISIYGSPGKVGEAGPQSIISVNRGARDGLEVGHVLALYTLGGTVRDTSGKDATIKLPDERAGLAFVFRVFDRVSYALVMNVSKPIGPLDVVQTP